MSKTKDAKTLRKAARVLDKRWPESDLTSTAGVLRGLADELAPEPSEVYSIVLDPRPPAAHTPWMARRTLIRLAELSGQDDGHWFTLAEIWGGQTDAEARLPILLKRNLITEGMREGTRTYALTDSGYAVLRSLV